MPHTGNQELTFGQALTTAGQTFDTLTNINQDPNIPINFAEEDMDGFLSRALQGALGLLGRGAGAASRFAASPTGQIGLGLAGQTIVGGTGSPLGQLLQTLTQGAITERNRQAILQALGTEGGATPTTGVTGLPSGGQVSPLGDLPGTDVEGGLSRPLQPSSRDIGAVGTAISPETPTAALLSGLEGSLGLTPQDLTQLVETGLGIERQRVELRTEAERGNLIQAQTEALRGSEAARDAQLQRDLQKIEAGQALTPLETRNIESQISSREAGIRQIEANIARETDPNNIRNLETQIDILKKQQETAKLIQGQQVTLTQQTDKALLDTATSIIKGLAPRIFTDVITEEQIQTTAQLRINLSRETQSTDAEIAAGASAAIQILDGIESIVPDIIRNNPSLSSREIANIIKTEIKFGREGLTATGEITDQGIAVFRDKDENAFFEVKPNIFQRFDIK